jgi:hypothetical protein
MKLRLTFAITLLIFLAYNSFGQSPKDSSWMKPPVVYLDFKEKHSWITAACNDTGLISVNEVPDKIVIEIADSTAEKTAIKFINEKDNFIVAMNCAGKPGCIPIKLSDIAEGRLELTIHKKELIRIGKRSLDTPKKIDGNAKLQIVFSKKEDGNNKAKTETVKKGFPNSALHLPIPEKDTNKIKELEKCVWCYVPVECTEPLQNCLPVIKGAIDREGLLKKFLKYFEGSKNTKKGFSYGAIQTDSLRWYRINADGRRELLSDTRLIRPYAGSALQMAVMAPDTAEISMSIDGESYFLEQGQNSFFTASAAASTTVENKEINPEGDPDSKEGKEFLNLNEADGVKKSPYYAFIPELRTFSDIQMIKAVNYYSIARNENDSLKTADSFKKKTNRDSALKINERTLDSLAKSFSKIDWKKFIASIKKDSLSKEGIAIDWRNKLRVVDIVLQRFNAKYSSGNFIQSEMRKELANILQGIKHCLGIFPTITDPASLKNEIIRQIELNVDTAYYKALAGLVETINSEYSNALSKKSNKTIFIKQVQVPDEDKIKVTIKDIKNAKGLNQVYNFNVKGGFKIDFSSGVFFSDVNNPEFVLTKSVFKYRETKDTVVILAGGVPKDSIMYTGQIATTSGSLIQKNKSKLNYGAGFFAHAYRRSGHAFNWGACIGATLNNTGQVYGMLGLSLMLRAGNNRIALMGGFAAGKEKELSVSAANYIYKPEYAEYENGAKLWDNIRVVPGFYDNVSNEIQTHETTRIKCFIGLSVNFASVSLKK